MCLSGGSRGGPQSGEPSPARPVLQETQTHQDGVLALAAAPIGTSLREEPLCGRSGEEAAGQRAVPDGDAGRPEGHRGMMGNGVQFEMWPEASMNE